MNEANLLTVWAKLLLGSFADAGVTDVVLSPGSRSTPFLVAAARNARLHCHDVIDERAAAFFALGQARVTGRPSLLLCTSGTAAAHYFPAVVEASASHLPLLALTADRPFELQGCAAPQTIDQQRLYGDHARGFFELGMPDGDLQALRALRRMAAQATTLAMGPVPGAVHLNVRARKPLEPVGPLTDAERALERRVEELLARPISLARRPRAVVDGAMLAEISSRIRRAQRGLIVCGPAGIGQAESREAVFALAARTGYPVLCEASSQLRFTEAPSAVVICDGFDALLRSQAFRKRHPPELVVQLGTPPVSSGWERYLQAHPDCERVVVAPHGWNDPQSSASLLLWAEVEDVARALTTSLSDLPSRARHEWGMAFHEANARVWEIAERQVGASSEQSPFTAANVARELTAALPAEALLMVGNSLAIRDVDAWCKAGSARAEVLCQRGVNGIDGLIAGACGSARASGRPLALLLGDVSFLHDLTSLGLARRLASPLVVVVVDNGGGRIFEQLPLAKVEGLEPEVFDHVVTPPDVQLEHASALFGHPHVRVDSVETLRAALREGFGRTGCTVIEAKVPPHSAAEQNGRLYASVDALWA